MYVTLASFFFRSSSQSCYVNHIFIKEGKATTEEKETVKKKKNRKQIQ